MGELLRVVVHPLMKIQWEFGVGAPDSTKSKVYNLSDLVLERKSVVVKTKLFEMFFFVTTSILVILVELA